MFSTVMSFAVWCQMFCKLLSAERCGKFRKRHALSFNLCQRQWQSFSFDNLVISEILPIFMSRPIGRDMCTGVIRWWFPVLRPADVCAIDTCCHLELQWTGRLSGVVCSHWWLRYCLCSARLRCAFSSNQGWKKFNRTVEWCSMLMMIMLLLVLHVVELCILQQSVCYWQWLIFSLLDLFLSGITVIPQFSSLT